MGTMAKILMEAMEEISNLPEADQEKIGRELLSHLERLRRLLRRPSPISMQFGTITYELRAATPPTR
jgi:hypothetical protein